MSLLTQRLFHAFERPDMLVNRGSFSHLTHQTNQALDSLGMGPSFEPLRPHVPGLLSALTNLANLTFFWGEEIKDVEQLWRALGSSETCRMSLPPLFDPGIEEAMKRLAKTHPAMDGKAPWFATEEITILRSTPKTSPENDLIVGAAMIFRHLSREEFKVSLELGLARAFQPNRFTRFYGFENPGIEVSSFGVSRSLDADSGTEGLAVGGRHFVHDGASTKERMGRETIIWMRWREGELKFADAMDRYGAEPETNSRLDLVAQGLKCFNLEGRFALSVLKDY